ncbi:Uncharacterised protein r2_g3162 [Pycnogonum litorale]
MLFIIVLLAVVSNCHASISGTFTRPQYDGSLFYQVANKSSPSLNQCALDCLRLDWCFTFVFQNGACDVTNCYFLNSPLMGPDLSSDYQTFIRDIDDKGKHVHVYCKS